MTPNLKRSLALFLQGAIVLIGITGIYGLAVLRFQRVEIQDAATQRTCRYWRALLLPSQDSTVSLEKEGQYKAKEYNINGLFGLLSAETLSGGRYRLPHKTSIDQSIEDAERINVQQMERLRRSWDRAK